MVLDFLVSQVAAELTTIAILALTLGLAVVITMNYMKRRTRSLMFWSMGVWFFALAALLEVLFASGTYSEVLIRLYLLVFALIMEFLALGSMELVRSQYLRITYRSFAIFSTALLLSALVIYNIGNILTNYVVYGNMPQNVIFASYFVTLPAAAVLVVVAAKGYMARRSKKTLSIIAGAVIVSVSGALYIVQYPALLYLLGFIGILALWYGFM